MNLSPRLALVTGGAASGKSAFAEQLAAGSSCRPVYLATAEPRDAEMRQRIAAHIRRRDQRWSTVETTVELRPILASFGPDRTVLLDCATMWLSNRFEAGPGRLRPAHEFLEALDAAKCPIIVVSNELGSGVVSVSKPTRRFVTEQGLLNQAVAQRADLVAVVISGIPWVLKGELASWRAKQTSGG